MDEQARKRIVEITVMLVEGMVAAGEVDPDDDEALRTATRRCAADARATYNAALEFISG
jgi:hypothetical protein